MEVDIHFHDNYLLAGENPLNCSEDQKREINLWLLGLISTLVDSEENFVLDKLKHIFVTNDYAQELYDFQKEKGLKQGHTKNEVGEGQAMTLSYKNELGNEESVIFFKAEFIFGLYTSEQLKETLPENDIKMLFNIFFHELCHINDDYHMKELFDIDVINNCTVLPRNLYPISIYMWREYYAYRKSAEKFPYGDLMLSHLKETSEWVYKQIVNLHEKYQENGDLDGFLIDFTSKIRYLLRVMVSVIGNVHGYTSDIYDQKELFEVATQKLSNIKIRDSFFELITELNLLFEEYPFWGDLARIDILNSIVLNCFRAFGVSPSEVENDQMYVGIDFINM